MNFTDMVKQDLEQERYRQLKTALEFVSDDISVNNILSDLEGDPLYNTFLNNFRIDGEVLSNFNNKDLLNVPLVKIADRATFNHEAFDAKIKENQKKRELKQKRRQAAQKANKTKERKKKQLETELLFKSDKNKTKFYLHYTPFHYMKDLVFQLNDVANLPNPSKLEIIKITNLLKQYFNGHS